MRRFGLFLTLLLAGCGGSLSSPPLPAAPDHPAPPPQVHKADLEVLWTQIGSRNSGQACDAMWALEARGDEAVAFLKDKLMPPTPDAARVGGLIARLDDDRYDVRETATRELQGMGEPVRGFLEEALKKEPSPEVRERLTQLLEALEGAAEWRRENGAQVLEAIGTAKAREVLAELKKRPN